MSLRSLRRHHHTDRIAWSSHLFCVWLDRALPGRGRSVIDEAILGVYEAVRLLLPGAPHSSFLH